MNIRIFLTVLAAASVVATTSSAATVRAWTDDPANFSEGSSFAKKDGSIGEFAQADAVTGKLSAFAESGPNFDQALAGATLFGTPTDPIIVNTSTTQKLPVELFMRYEGTYLVPEVEFAVANSTGLVSILATSGSSSASYSHTVDYFQGEFRAGGVEDARNGGSVSLIYADESGLWAEISTGLILLEPGEAASISYLLEVNGGNGGGAIFAQTAYVSIFVGDKSIVSVDPQFASWVCEFGETCNGPETQPPAVPLPAGFPLLIVGLAALIGVRLLGGRSD